MVKIIRLSSYKFDKGHIQHNVTLSVSGLFDEEGKMMEERIRIMSVLLETVCPNTMTIVSLNRSAHQVNSPACLQSLSLYKRDRSYSVGEEIALDQLKDVMLYCYAERLELELDVLDIKNQHVTFVANRELLGYHYLFGSPETFTGEYLENVKKKLKDCTFSGSFRKNL